MLDDWHDNGVSHRIIGFMIGSRQLIAFRSAHEAGGFASSDQPGVPFPGIVQQEKLATTAALSGTQATR